MRYLPGDLIAFAAGVGQSLGMEPTEARHFSQSLVYADMRGLHSHGLMRMPTYVERIRRGLIAVGAQPDVLRDGGSLLAIDGGNGLGACIAQKVMELCVERARETGVCIAAVQNSNHFGYSAYFTGYAAACHMVGFAVANAFKSMAPYGGTQPMLGTNPLCVAIPAYGREPFVLDMATSLVAQGKIILAEKEGRQIPLDWGLDSEGRPTSDPAAVLDGGSLTPFGGAKGYGLALMIELLCVCLANAAKSTEMGSMYDFTRVQGTGFVLGAIDPGRIMDPGQFENAVTQLLAEIKASPKSWGTEEIYIPGEIEAHKFQEALESGIDLSEPVIRELRRIGADCGMPFPVSSADL